ncbi:MAG: hypothetical protein V7K32_02975 [Nostoc sp.]
MTWLRWWNNQGNSLQTGWERSDRSKQKRDVYDGLRLRNACLLN